MKKLTCLLLALALAGCAGAQVKRDVVLERIPGNSPDWVLKDTFEKDRFLYVVGEGSDLEGYPLAGRVAKAAAVQKLAEATGLRMKSELTRSAQRLGVQSAGSYLQDTVAMATELVTVQDLTQEDSYREKLQLVETHRVSYRVVGLFKVPVDQFTAAKVRALESWQGKAAKAQDIRAAEEAKKLLDDVRAN